MQQLKKRLMVWAGLVLLLLCIPLVLTIRDGNVPNVGWNWSPFDFVFMFILLFGAATCFELIASRSNSLLYRVALGGATLTAVLLVWVNAAVGIIGDDNGTNLMYFAALVLGFLVAAMSAFKPAGMARAMFTTAAALAVVAVIALVFFSAELPGPIQILGLNAFFIMLFVGSGVLFQRTSMAAKQ